MIKTISPSDMRAMERAAIERGVPSLLLMERAARACAEAIRDMLGDAKDKRALFLCGEGNNGGDGLAAARMFMEMCGRAVVVLTGEPKTLDAKINLDYLRLTGAEFYEDIPDIPFDVAVDALLGTGLRGAPEGKTKALIEKLNALCLPVLAVDIPSGLDGETGRAPGECVNAALTVTFHRAKPGLYLTGRPGRVSVAPIGLPASLDDAPGYDVLEDSDLPAFFPPLKKDAHKGMRGRALLLCGSRGMAGAAAVAGNACVRGGAGLTTVLCDCDALPIVQALCPCATALTDASKAPPYDVLLAGCGMGMNREEDLFALYDPARPCVLDADALTLLSKNPRALSPLTVLTPHPGEAARLLQVSAADITENPVSSARAIAEKYRCVAVLKGHTTVITDGARVTLNVSGTPGMAKGGSGDALAGLTAALLLSLPPYDAARAACFLHGRAGTRAAEKKGERSMTALDLISEIRF